MRQKNNGQGENNILQNQFTAYLMTAVRRQKIDYLRRRARLGKYELPTGLDSAFTQTLDALAENTRSVEQLVLESITLAQALDLISDRERYVFLARALEERGFGDLSAELGIGYNSAASIYYRAIQKLKRKM